MEIRNTTDQAARLAGRHDLEYLYEMAKAKQGEMDDRRYRRFKRIVWDAIEIHESRTR